MPKPNSATDLQQSRSSGGPETGVGDPEPLRGPQEESGIAGRLRGGEQQQPLRVLGQSLKAQHEVLFDSALKRQCPRKAEAAGQLVRRQAARQFEERERVAFGFGEDLIADPLVEWRVEHRVQQLAGVAVSQPAERQLR